MGLHLVTLTERIHIFLAFCLHYSSWKALPVLPATALAKLRNLNHLFCGNLPVFEVLLWIEVFCGFSTSFFQQKGGTSLNYSRYVILWELANKVDLAEGEVLLGIVDSWPFVWSFVMFWPLAGRKFTSVGGVVKFEWKSLSPGDTYSA